MRLAVERRNLLEAGAGNSAGCRPAHYVVLVNRPSDHETRWAALHDVAAIAAFDDTRWPLRRALPRE